MHSDNATEKDCVYDDSAGGDQSKERQLVDVGGTAEVASSSASISFTVEQSAGNRVDCARDAMSLLSLV